LLNATVRLQLSTKKPIKTVTNPKEAVLAIRTVERDPTTILITGQSPGITCVELEDADGNKEVYEIHVQADIEYLKCQLRRAVPHGDICAIPNGTNTVILTGFINRAEDIQVALLVTQSAGFQPINALRVSGVQQVQLDVVIARVARSKTRDFGFNFLQNSSNQIFGSTVGSLIPALGPVGVPSGQLQPMRYGPIINSPPGAANIFSGIIGPHSGFLGFLQALEQENLAKVLAQPRLVTLSGNPASFLDGGEQAVPIPAGLGQVGVQFEEFGTRLNFLPIVLGNGKIHLEVEPEVSILSNAGSVTLFAGGQPVQGRQTQRVHTTVELETGQTFVIGGLIQHQLDAQTTKIPVLGQLPFIGAAFSTKAAVESETELVVLVTPYLVDAQSCDQLVKVLPGQETRTPDDFELFLEGILEAPRGKREICNGNRYVPAYKNGPTSHIFPCGPTCCGGGKGGCANGNCGNGGCENGSCGNGGCANGSCGNGGFQAGHAAPGLLPSVPGHPVGATAPLPAGQAPGQPAHSAAAPLPVQPAVSTPAARKPVVSLPPAPATRPSGVAPEGGSLAAETPPPAVAPVRPGALPMNLAAEKP
jgi:pilus assembly protein CpaC